MLGRALDAAANQRQQQQEEEQNLLLPGGSEDVSEGGSSSISKIIYGQQQQQEPQQEQEEQEFASYDDTSSSYQITEWQQEGSGTNDDESQKSNFLDQCWWAIRECFAIVANVDNVWDSPHSPRRYLAVTFWFSVLATSYAIERGSFKLLVDRAGPFRLFSVQVITATHGIFLGIGMMMSALVHKKEQGFKIMKLGLPLADVGLMAVLDTVHLVLVVITGAYVAPTLTVILVQLTIPLTAFFMQLVHPHGSCSRLCYRRNNQDNSNVDFAAANSEREDASFFCCGGLLAEHVWGATIIFIAVTLGLVPSFLSLQDPDVFVNQDSVPAQRRAYNTIIFALACIPAAASQLYKEHVLLQYRQPIDGNSLNLILVIFQFGIALALSPLVYPLQGLGAGSDWIQLYPSKETSGNFGDGLKCFFGMLDTKDAESTYPEEAQCQWSLVIAMLYVLATVSVGFAVDKIVQAGATKIMYRGISAGIILAILVMYVYEYFDPQLNYGSIQNTLHMACTVLLVVGAEVYHRVRLPDSTFETVYPEPENLYEDEG